MLKSIYKIERTQPYLGTEGKTVYLSGKVGGKTEAGSMSRLLEVSESKGTGVL